MSFTNGYIDKTGKRVLKKFLGCFPADLPPKTNKSNFSLIFNLSKHNEEGSHYIAIHSTTKKIIYFDSFGQPIKNKLIKSFVRKHLKRKKFLFNKVKIQDDQSSFCGIFCLSFLACQEKNISLQEYHNLFNSSSLKENDTKSVNILKSFIMQ